MDKKTETWMMSPEGIKAIWDRFDSIDKQLAFLTNWLAQTSVDLENQSKQLTTVEPTPTAPTPDNQWPAVEYTNPGMNLSWQSARVGIKSGPAEHNSECAHEWYPNRLPFNLDGILPRVLLVHCRLCHASRSYDLTPAQDVVPISSTSVKQPLNESVVNSVEESAKSPLSGWWNNGFEMPFRKGENGDYHFHSAHRHENGNRWHVH